MSAQLTNHAIERAKERLSLRRPSLQRLADSALQAGIKHGDVAGRLNRFFNEQYLQERKANNIRIYGEHVFIFADALLITVFEVPKELKTLSAKIWATRKEARA